MHAAYSLVLTPSDYHLLALMGHTLAKQQFSSYEDIKKNGSMTGLQQKGKIFTGLVFINYPRVGKNV